MIEQIEPTLVSAASGPTVLCRQRAKRDCGCAVYVGRREDNLEAATLARECSPDHRPLIARFQEALLASLDHPQPRSAIEVVDELLQAAA